MRGFRLQPSGLLVVVTLMVTPSTAFAGNSDEVNAGTDVTLTGGAIVAVTYTGAALWYNPAGIARIDQSSLEITGITFQTQIVRVPGIVTIGTDTPTESSGKTTNFFVIPEAVTFAIVLRENLKLGIGVFNSALRRSLFTEDVTTAAEFSPEVNVVGGQNTRLNFYHLSGGMAAKFGKKQRLLFGGALDFVVANSRFDRTGSVSYDDGQSGLFADGVLRVDTGFGFQLKTGIQWVPIEEVRIGVSVASPTFGFARIERSAETLAQSPPIGVTLPPDDPGAQRSGGVERRSRHAGWWGIEPGNLRLGIAYVGNWGWVEADVILQWRLRTPEFQLDLQRVVNGRIGAAFRLTRFMKLGLGMFTDRSPIDRLSLAPLATTDIDFYGVHLGLLFSNREVSPDRFDDERSQRDGRGVAIAIGLRYAYGTGDVLGRLVPPQYDPASIETLATSGRIHEITINLGAKVHF